MNAKESDRKVDYRDVAGLKAVASTDFSAWSDPIEVTQATIDEFSRLSGDDYWIHSDPERAARESPFGTTIAQGMLVQSLSSRLNFAMPVTVTGFRNMVNYGSERVRFPSPVPAGSSIRGRCRVKDARRTPAGTLLTLEIHIHVVGNERPSVTNEVLILYM